MRNRVLPLLAALAAFFLAGLYLGHHIAEKNNEEYFSKIRHNFEQRELGYKIRLDALSKAGCTAQLRSDSLLSLHRDLVREDSLIRLELKRVKGSFDKFTPTELATRMIEEYNKSK